LQSFRLRKLLQKVHQAVSDMLLTLEEQQASAAAKLPFDEDAALELRKNKRKHLARFFRPQTPLKVLAESLGTFPLSSSRSSPYSTSMLIA
jgi:hypothetical protein